MTNIIATVKKVNEKKNQKSFQNVVYPFYNALKQRGFPVEEIEELIKKKLDGRQGGGITKMGGGGQIIAKNKLTLKFVLGDLKHFRPCFFFH